MKNQINQIMETIKEQGINNPETKPFADYWKDLLKAFDIMIVKGKAKDIVSNSEEEHMCELRKRLHAEGSPCGVLYFHEETKKFFIIVTDEECESVYVGYDCRVNRREFFLIAHAVVQYLMEHHQKDTAVRPVRLQYSEIVRELLLPTAILKEYTRIDMPYTAFCSVDSVDEAFSEYGVDFLFFLERLKEVGICPVIRSCKNLSLLFIANPSPEDWMIADSNNTIMMEHYRASVRVKYQMEIELKELEDKKNKALKEFGFPLVEGE